ncbi:serine/threonine-protein kinase [Arthrobacter sp. LAPM80]|uniref:serine/threonine-protein kinase n=1 Tax=Arthrobacter sp. LAPM80 TaxID=3141788 RepID=UPI00398B4B46
MNTFSPDSPENPPPSIPGHDPVRSLGSGAQGRVWLMAPRDGSAPVAAKVLAHPAGVVGGESVDGTFRNNESHVTREWQILTQFRHEHLIPVHSIVVDDVGSRVLLMDHAAGGSLAQIVRAKGPLTVGEAVTVLTPMGQVLSFLHGRGAVHGDVSPGNVLLSAAGKPLLSDFGLGRLLGQPAEPLAGTPGFYCAADSVRDEAADVYALAAVGWFALTGQAAPATRDRLPLGTFVQDVPPELVAALEAGLNEVAARRPTAAAFAQAIFRSARAEPVALGNAVHPSVLPELLTRKDAKARRGGRRAGKLGLLWGSAPAKSWQLWNRRSATAVASALAALAVVLACWGFLLVKAGWSDSSAVGIAPATTAEVSLPWAAALPAGIQKDLADHDPVVALPALAWVRSYALSNADAGLLAKVNAPGSAAFKADQQVVQELKDRGHTLTGLDTGISHAGTDYVGATETGDPGPSVRPLATVRATVTTSPFAEQDAAGANVHTQTQEQSQELTIVMVREDSRWQIQQILAVDAQ